MAEGAAAAVDTAVPEVTEAVAAGADDFMCQRLYKLCKINNKFCRVAQITALAIKLYCKKTSKHGII